MSLIIITTLSTLGFTNLADIYIYYYPLGTAAAASQSGRCLASRQQPATTDVAIKEFALQEYKMYFDDRNARLGGVSMGGVCSDVPATGVSATQSMFESLHRALNEKSFK